MTWSRSPLWLFFFFFSFFSITTSTSSHNYFYPSSFRAFNFSPGYQKKLSRESVMKIFFPPSFTRVLERSHSSSFRSKSTASSPAFHRVYTSWLGPCSKHTYVFPFVFAGETGEGGCWTGIQPLRWMNGVVLSGMNANIEGRIKHSTPRRKSAELTRFPTMKNGRVFHPPQPGKVDGDVR